MCGCEVRRVRPHVDCNELRSTNGEGEAFLSVRPLPHRRAVRGRQHMHAIPARGGEPGGIRDVVEEGGHSAIEQMGEPAHEARSLHACESRLDKDERGVLECGKRIMRDRMMVADCGGVPQSGMQLAAEANNLRPFSELLNDRAPFGNSLVRVSAWEANQPGCPRPFRRRPLPPWPGSHTCAASRAELQTWRNLASFIFRISSDTPDARWS